MRMNNDGQAALVDAILFMTVMLIASAVIIGSASSSRPVDVQYSGLQQYLRNFAQTLLAVELCGMSYIDVTGQYILLEDSGRSIGQLLCDEAMVLSNGHGQSDFTDYEIRVMDAANSLLRPGMGYAISCDETAVFISNCIGDFTELPPDRFASQMVIFSDIGASYRISITVSLWVA